MTEAEQERTAIVAWLRGCADRWAAAKRYDMTIPYELRAQADAIEAGRHLTGDQE